MWPTISAIYTALAEGQELPEVMPPRERRALDALLQDAHGRTHILEVDESQHFNRFRAISLSLYPPTVEVAFPIGKWTEASAAKQRLEGGGWGKPKPPLFDMENGRHRQRAFRDALADLLPGVYGWGPTIRVADFELEPWIWGAEAVPRFHTTFANRFGADATAPEDLLPDPPTRPTRPRPATRLRSTGTARSQPVTGADIAGGRIRIPAASKAVFPSVRGPVNIVLRGASMTVRYDPRIGPDRNRSGVLGVGRRVLANLVGADEVLTVTADGGLLHLD